MLHLPPLFQLRLCITISPTPINTHGTIWFIQNASKRVQKAASIRSNLSAGSSGLMGYHTAHSRNVVNNRLLRMMWRSVSIVPVLNQLRITNPLRSGLLLASWATVITCLEHDSLFIFKDFTAWICNMVFKLNCSIFSTPCTHAGTCPGSFCLSSVMLANRKKPPNSILHWGIILYNSHL